MRNLSRAGTLTLVAGLALALAGCVPQPYPIVPTSQPTVAPVFKSDAAALAAAKKAYEGYLAASDAIGNDGGKDANRIAPWVTKDRLPKELKVFAGFANTGRHLAGNSSYSKFTLQQLDQLKSGKVTLAAYVCDDVSHSRVVDATGTDVTRSDRQDVVAVQVNFKNTKAGSPTLLIEGSKPWSGTDFCS
jgi:hypothetical protein